MLPPQPAPPAVVGGGGGGGTRLTTFNRLPALRAERVMGATALNAAEEAGSSRLRAANDLLCLCKKNFFYIALKNL